MKQTRNLEDLLRQYDLLAAPAAREFWQSIFLSL